MPIGIFLYEIDESFGPNILAEYYLSDVKISQEILKDFIEKHDNGVLIIFTKILPRKFQSPKPIRL